MPGIARWHRAIEYAISNFRTINDVDRLSNTQGVHRELPGYKLPRIIGNHFREQVTLPVKRPASITKTIETNLQ